MPKSYTKKRKGERTSIAIDPLLTNRIDKILKTKEKLAEFARKAINEKLWDREREAITSLTSTEQFHKIETMKEDIDELKWRHDFLESEVNRFKKEQEEIRKEFVFSDAYYKILMISSFDKDNTDEFKHKWIKENIFSVINEDEYMKWKAQESKKLFVK